MSAPTCLFFYGLRFDVDKGSIEALEERTHPTLVAARKVGLQHYWGNFAEPGERYLLFVGAKLGVLGIEHLPEVRIDESALTEKAQETRAKVREAGLSGEPAVYLQ